MSAGDHDATFKAVFMHPEHARGALHAVLPTVFGEALDWSTLTHVPGSYVDSLLQSRHTDLLFTIAWRGGGNSLVYVLFEHQSSNDDLMAFRLLRYLVRIWDHWLDEHPEADALPAIVPVVLYHGHKAWSAPTAFDALIALPDVLRASVAPHLVRFTYLLDDLSEISDDQLRARAMSALGRLVQVCFKYARTAPNLLEVLTRWADVMGDVAGAPNGLAALEMVMQYVVMANNRFEPHELQPLVDRVTDSKGEGMMMTVGERIRREGIEAGIEAGIQRGEERGIQKGARELLLRQLRMRFGSQVNNDAVRRLETASTEQLTTWAERVLSARTLAELFVE
jgi:predicted transposase/invertase (TIGR01784 family)